MTNLEAEPTGGKCLRSKCQALKKTLLVFTFSYCVKQGVLMAAQLIPSKPKWTVTQKHNFTFQLPLSFPFKPATCADTRGLTWPLHDNIRRNHWIFKIATICAPAVSQILNLFHLTFYCSTLANSTYSFNVNEGWMKCKILTNVQTPLFGSVLSGVPVLPVFQLIISTLLLSKHHHHYTLAMDKHTQCRLAIMIFSVWFLSINPKLLLVSGLFLGFFLTLTLVMGCCMPLLSTSLRVIG